MHIRARMHVVISPIRVFVARGMKTRARAAEAHAMGTRSSIGSVSLLYALSVFFHRIFVYSSFVFLVPVVIVVVASPRVFVALPVYACIRESRRAPPA